MEVIVDANIFIADYLEQSGKLRIDNDGRIVWTWNPTMIKKIKRFGVKIR